MASTYHVGVRFTLPVNQGPHACALPVAIVARSSGCEVHIARDPLTSGSEVYLATIYI